MKVQRHGQAKILTTRELIKVFSEGLSRARDQSLGGLCYYAALRISEARRLPTECAFRGDSVSEVIVVPKHITKGQLETRSIPTHPTLARILRRYYVESQQLLDLREKLGSWGTKSFSSDGNYIFHNLQCVCGSSRLWKDGRRKEEYYFCKSCKHHYPRSQLHSLPAHQHKKMHLKDFFGVKASHSYGFFDPTKSELLFPGSEGRSCLSLDAALDVFHDAFEQLNIMGASSHSFRRTCLTTLHRAKVTLPVIQKISGHRDLDVLQKYLEVDPDDIKKAIFNLDY